MFLFIPPYCTALVGTMFQRGTRGHKMHMKDCLGRKKKTAENQLNLNFTPHRELVKNSFERTFYKTFYKTRMHVLKACLFIVLFAVIKNK